jgi:predicted O-methyltransferase YrrM
MTFDPRPFTPAELWESAHATQGFSKHLLAIYSMAVGLDAQRIVEFGLGNTTRALRLAVGVTGGTLQSCDCDRERFAYLLPQQDSSWTLALSGSDTFLRSVDGPLDLVVHDSAHDYYQVKQDLEMLLPKMRTFGLICLHDTQQPELSRDMLSAIRDGTRDWAVSITNLPYSAGLAILRIEEGVHPARPTKSTMPDGRSPDTVPVAMAMRFADDSVHPAEAGPLRYLRWRLRKLVKGY